MEQGGRASLVQRMALVAYLRRLHDYTPSEASIRTIVDVACDSP